MKTIVISQPMFFPWIGIFEQVRLANIYVHYDDVQIPQGRSFVTRVQLKAPQGIVWLTVPVVHQGKQLIRDVRIDDTQPWRSRQLKTLQHLYAKAPFATEMLQIADEVLSNKSPFLSELNRHAIELISGYFGLQCEFKLSSDFSTASSSTLKLLETVRLLHGDIYVTGHGARNYMDHEMFEREGVRVEYMNYERAPYPQLHGDFNPHVSILDLIANTGKEGRRYIRSKSVDWKEFIQWEK